MVDTFDSAQLRQAFGTFATGVTIVTAINDDNPVGMVVNSFSSVSLDPPMALFCAAKSSDTWKEIQAAGHFAVNVLPLDMQPVSAQFVGPAPQRYDGVDWHAEVTGAPILDDAMAYLDCDITHEYDGGDHVIVVGTVRALGLMRADQTPLCYFRGAYAQMAL